MTNSIPYIAYIKMKTFEVKTAASIQTKTVCYFKHFLLASGIGNLLSTFSAVADCIVGGVLEQCCAKGEFDGQLFFRIGVTTW